MGKHRGNIAKIEESGSENFDFDGELRKIAVKLSVQIKKMKLRCDHMELKPFLDLLKSTPSAIEFEQTMAVIDAHYQFSPISFSNGTARNPAGENNGSCKIFAFAHRHQLSEEQTLALFGRYYRQDVLGNPDGDDHQNIRNFIAHGWPGIKFEGSALN